MRLQAAQTAHGRTQAPSSAATSRRRLRVARRLRGSAARSAAGNEVSQSGAAPSPASARRTFASIAVALVRSTRPQQWIKNVLVFAGLVFSRQLTDGGAVRSGVLAFALFVLASGGIYLVNDLLDLDADRAHPLKRKRPLASGALPPPVALAAAVLLIGGALVGAFLMQLALGALLAVYVGVNLAYSARLKHIVLLDVLLIASGFLLRAAAGAVAVVAPISPWLYLCTLLLALLIVLGKRRSELTLLGPRAAAHRRNLTRYSVTYLDRWLKGIAAITVVAYVLYTFFAPATVGNPKLIMTVPFVVLGLVRYLRLARRPGGAESPEVLLFRDPWLQASVALWGATVLALLYLVH